MTIFENTCVISMRISSLISLFFSTVCLPSFDLIALSFLRQIDSAAKIAVKPREIDITGLSGSVCFGLSIGSFENACSDDSIYSTSCDIIYRGQSTVVVFPVENFLLFNEKLINEWRSNNFVLPKAYLCHSTTSDNFSLIADLNIVLEPGARELGFESYKTPWRVFLSPGWSEKFILSSPIISSKSVIALKSSGALCEGPPSLKAIQVISVDMDDSSTDFSGAQYGLKTAIFHGGMDFRNSTLKNSILQPHLGRGRSTSGIMFHVCYYPLDLENQAGGTMIGSMLLFASNGDAACLILFILLIVLGIPPLCAVTVSCFAFKVRKMRNRARKEFLIRELQDVERSLLAIQKSEEGHVINDTSSQLSSTSASSSASTAPSSTQPLRTSDMTSSQRLPPTSSASTLQVGGTLRNNDRQSNQNRTRRHRGEEYRALPSSSASTQR